MEVWILIQEDRRSDTDAVPYDSYGKALADARSLIKSMGLDPDQKGDEHHPPEELGEQPIGELMEADGWVYFFQYGESHIRIIKRHMNGVIE